MYKVQKKYFVKEKRKMEKRLRVIYCSSFLLLLSVGVFIRCILSLTKTNISHTHFKDIFFPLKEKENSKILEKVQNVIDTRVSERYSLDIYFLSKL